MTVFRCATGHDSFFLYSVGSSCPAGLTYFRLSVSLHEGPLLTSARLCFLVSPSGSTRQPFPSSESGAQCGSSFARLILCFFSLSLGIHALQQVQPSGVSSAVSGTCKAVLSSQTARYRLANYYVNTGGTGRSRTCEALAMRHRQAA